MKEITKIFSFEQAAKIQVVAPDYGCYVVNVEIVGDKVQMTIQATQEDLESMLNATKD